MKPYQRRAVDGYPYYKIAFWDIHNLCWQDGKKTFVTVEAAKDSISRGGKYRLSRITELGRVDLEPFCR